MHGYFFFHYNHVLIDNYSRYLITSNNHVNMIILQIFFNISDRLNYKSKKVSRTTGMQVTTLFWIRPHLNYKSKEVSHILTLLIYKLKLFSGLDPLAMQMVFLVTLLSSPYPSFFCFVFFNMLLQASDV